MYTGPLALQLQGLRNYFHSGATRSYDFRKKQLQQLKQALLQYEQELHNALFTDLKKNPEEAWVTETGLVQSEITTAFKGLHTWMQPESAGTNLVNFPSSSRVLREPLGVVLIIGAWNYPFQLLFAPLVGAIAAGNCIVLKPSEHAPATAAVMKKIIDSIFSPQYILYVEGDGATVVPALMKDFRYDHVFYTGGAMVGKLIYQMAAEKLTPVTLELGGKSPCIVEADANISVAARRIAVTKFSNAGQMCIAPDYVLVHASRKDELMQELKKAIATFYEGDPSSAYSYGRIVNERQFNRLVNYLGEGTIVQGGQYNKEQLYIEPTILENIKPEAAVMNEEIFGPILPVIAYGTTEEAMAVVRQHPDPLSLYVFTNSKKTEEIWLQSIPFGGGCVNNTSWHFTNHHLPFGGRGSSGMGTYHGRHSFEVFSHRKAIMKTPTWFDPAVKYPPFKGKLKLFKWIIR